MAVDTVHLKEDDWLSLFLFIATPLLVVCSHSSFKKRNVSAVKSDEYYLQKAHQLRISLDKPRQSRFRVVALIVLNDGTVIPGTNDEPSPAITGALCAERAAFLQLRLVLLEKKQKQNQQQQQQQVEKVYIVTDASIPVPPGMLCREYMYGHDAISCPNRTLFILQSADSTSEPLILTLADLYPYPPFYVRLSVEEIAIKGQELCLAANNALTSSSNASQKIADMIAHPSNDVGNMLVENAILPRLLAAARTALELDNRDMVHPLRFGAAAAILRKKRNADTAITVEIVNAGQRKAAEYGASLDAVCQLASSFQQNDDTVVFMMVVQLDQYGILHPPFGIARTFLVEHGHGDCVCLFMRERLIDADDTTTIHCPDDKQQEMLPSARLELVAVPAKTLAPFPPEFR